MQVVRRLGLYLDPPLAFLPQQPVSHHIELPTASIHTIPGSTCYVYMYGVYWYSWGKSFSLRIHVAGNEVHKAQQGLKPQDVPGTRHVLLQYNITSTYIPYLYCIKV